MRKEIRDKRGYKHEWFIREDGRRVFRAYTSAHYYDNKLGVGDGEKGFRKIDPTLVWQDSERAWKMQFAPFQVSIPLYADDWFSFRDIFKEKNQETRFKPKALHIKGVLVNNEVVYQDAFGLGRDLIIRVTRKKLQKLVRIRSGYKAAKDAVFDFDFDVPKGKKVARARGFTLGDGTILQSFRMWDSGTIDGERRGQIVEACPVETIGSVFRKTIPGEFQQRARGDVYADVTITYDEDKDTYYGTSFGTGGNPDSVVLNIGGWGDFYYSYLEFDLSTLISTFDTITSAVLGLKVNSVAVNDSTTFIRRITASWTEAGVNSSSNPASTTTDQVQMANPVTTGAGNVDEKDVTAIVQSWVDGTNSNFGFKLHSTTNNNAAHSLHSSDAASPADEPYLEVVIPAVTIQKRLRYVTTNQNLDFEIDLRDPGTAFNIRLFDQLTDSVTKSLRYAVVTEHPITKSLKYTVISPQAVTKSLKYAVLTEQPITKSLKYAVLTEVPITKSLKYTVLTTPAPKTKSLKYTVITSPSITKSLTYALDTTNSFSVTKSLKYTVLTEHALTKSLKYAVLTDSAITKSLRYAVVDENVVTKSLKYTVIAPKVVQKSLTYRVVGDSVIVQKSLKYTVIAPHSVTKSLKYTVITTPSAKTKSLKYTVLTEHGITKSLRYAVSVEHPITKSLRYAVVPSIAVTKSLKYTVISPVTITKSLTYDVVNITVVSIQKSLKYTVITEQVKTKSLRYAVVAPVAVTKSLKYAVLTEVPVTKSLKYTVIAEKSVTKSLRYAVSVEHAITKSLTYVVIPPQVGGSLGVKKDTNTQVGVGNIIQGKKADTNIQVGVSRLK